MQSKEEIIKTLKILRRHYPDGGVLEIGKPYHMVVAVMLSARTTDAQVLKRLPVFFKSFPNPTKLAGASVSEIEKHIDTLGLYKSKAKNLKALGEMLVKDFKGEVPQTIDELVKLPGVGIKTASVVMVGAFGAQAIAVDTHVFRVVNRLGWVKAKTPEEMEKKLRKIVPEAHWKDINHTMVPFGRAICIPNPRCYACPVKDLCAFGKKNLVPPKNAEEILAEAETRHKALEKNRDAVKNSLV